MAETVKVIKDNNICFITMNRPEKLNALSVEQVEGMKTALENAENDEEIKAVILSGNGKAFCSGGDIDAMGRHTSPPKSISHMENTSSLTKKIYNLDKFVISAIHGFAAGAGFSLALASDFVIADYQTKFISSFRNIGLAPDLGLIYQLSKNVPTPIAKEWVTSGKPVDAEMIYSYGLINRLTKNKEVVDEAVEFCQFLVDGPPFSNKFVKYLFNNSDESSFEMNIVQENMIQSMMFQTEDVKEGINSFQEKRTPKFTGN